MISGVPILSPHSRLGSFLSGFPSQLRHRCHLSGVSSVDASLKTFLSCEELSSPKIAPVTFIEKPSHDWM